MFFMLLIYGVVAFRVLFLKYGYRNRRYGYRNRR